MLRNIKLTCEYDGTRFNGWQIQSSRHRTVQGEIEKAIRSVFGKHLTLAGSGRTDSGVHALGQTAHFKVASRMTTDEMTRALNARLPEDISLLSAQDVPLTFHSRFSAKRKIYRYVILNRKIPSALSRHFALYIPAKLNVRAMRKAAQDLLGRKDFRCFMASDPALRRSGRVKDTVRQIYRLDIEKRGDMIALEVEANGFLYKMVRNIVGTLLDVGKGRLSPEDIRRILRSKDRDLAGATAPAHGLFLVQVTY